MSEGPPISPAPPSVPRPVIVTLAVCSMLLAVLALVSYTIPGLVYAEPILDVYREAYAGTIAEADANQLSATSYYVFGAVLLVLAAVLLGLSRANDYFRKPPEFVPPPPALNPG